LRIGVSQAIDIIAVGIDLRELSPNFGDGLKNQAAAWA